MNQTLKPDIKILKKNDKIYYTIPSIKIISTKYTKIYIEIMSNLDLEQDLEDELNDLSSNEEIEVEQEIEQEIDLDLEDKIKSYHLSIKHLKSLCKTSVYNNKRSYNLSIKINNDIICSTNNTIPKSKLENNNLYSCIIEEYNYKYNNEDKIGLTLNVLKKIGVYTNINNNLTLQELINNQ